jgi:hypothetical protein
MSLVLWLLTLVLLGITGWGIQSVMTELAKPYPQQPINTVSRGFEVEGFIWSSRAPRALRRQYIATQACFVPAALCLAALVWLNEIPISVSGGPSYFAPCRFSWPAVWRGLSFGVGIDARSLAGRSRRAALCRPRIADALEHRRHTVAAGGVGAFRYFEQAAVCVQIARRQANQGVNSFTL